ncbi:hypothetical protein ABZ606_20960 [Streptomyces sp. NPDC012461]|uniref:hypothetical protein n=1 Tax=unclassified Streptomyces TaxID=2593676 RepID=UPI0013D8F538|nr:hypothetical protein [Streptomyces sp. SID9913]
MGSEEHACPSCGQPVELVVRRRKTLGAWVPSWVKGPCQNPRCADYVPPAPTDPAAPAEPHADPSGADGPTAPQNP